MSAPPDTERIRAALASVIDPETGHDLLAMGMIYAVERAGDQIRVTMTSTVRGCPMAEMLRLGVQTALAALPGLTRAEVVLTWAPPWTPARMGAPLEL